MKRTILSLCLSVALAVPLHASANTDEIRIRLMIRDLKTDELIRVRNYLDKVLWKSDFEEVTVPAGTYKIGQDIPAGTWVISAAGEYGSCEINYCQRTTANGNAPDYSQQVIFRYVVSDSLYQYDQSYGPCTLNMESGWYFICESPVIFRKNAKFSFTFK